MLKAYFANGLFTEADRDFNAKVVKQLREEFPQLEIYLPQENEAINDKSNFASSFDIAIGDNDNLIDSDILIAVLDGEVIDPGVACEIGFAAAKGKLIVGLSTDSRKHYRNENPQKIESIYDTCESQYHYKNLYVIGNVKINGFVTESTEWLIEILKTIIEEVPNER